MNSDNVLTAYQKASETDSFTMHNEFLKLLLEDVSPSGIERHYTFFNDTDNATLKRILGNGFLKRGQEGLLYLAEKLKTETDKLKKSNVIHLIGLSYNRQYLPIVAPFLAEEDEEVRYKAIIACGWLGDNEAIDLLTAHYTLETNTQLRAFTVSALRQIYFRHKETKDKIVEFVSQNIANETADEVIAVMIVVLQDLTNVRYGLRENGSTGEISGDVAKAKSKLLQKIKLL